MFGLHRNFTTSGDASFGGERFAALLIGEDRRFNESPIVRMLCRFDAALVILAGFGKRCQVAKGVKGMIVTEQANTCFNFRPSVGFSNGLVISVWFQIWRAQFHSRIKTCLPACRKSFTHLGGVCRSAHPRFVLSRHAGLMNIRMALTLKNTECHT
jgi:hypothetical protein